MLLNLKIKNINYDKTVLYWEVQPDAGEYLQSFGYNVQFSESKEGPWEDCLESPINAYGFVDNQARLGATSHRLYYRIKAINFANGSEFFSEPVCITEEQQNTLADFIAKQEQLYLKKCNHPFLVFPRKKFGKRCTKCYDANLRKSIRENCPACYGTTYENGYFYPIKIYLGLDPSPKIIDKNELGTTENYTVTGWASNEAIIEPDDLLVALNTQGERYIVQQVLPTALHGATVRQILTMTHLRTDHPVYRLPIDIDAYTIDEFNIFRREWTM